MIHFFKDITQDILRIPTFLDLFGDVKEDISFLPNNLQLFFYYGLGGLSFIIEGFLLIAIPKVLFIKEKCNLQKWVFVGVCFLLIFLSICAFLDPRYNPIKNNPEIAQKFVEFTQERPNCELQSNQLKSQPLNQFTNIAFFIASYFIFRLIKGKKVKDRGIYLLFFTSILIGFGSVSHHAVPNNFTLVLDGLPIYLFLIFGIYKLLYILLKNKLTAFLLTLLYLLINFLAPIFVQLPFDMNAITPIINLLFLLMLIFVFYKRFGSKTNLFVFSFVSYAFATLFFIIDEKICAVIPFGTHFLWHIFNAAAVYYFVRFIIEIKQLSLEDKSV